MVEEGGNFFALRIFEQGILMNNREHMVVGVNPKQFFILWEGDTAYTLQQGSNSFGLFLLVSELNVGGLRTSQNEIQDQQFRTEGVRQNLSFSLIVIT